MACFRGDLGVYEPRRAAQYRSEEHTSELQSRSDLVCRLLLEKKKKHNKNGVAHLAPRLPPIVRVTAFQCGNDKCRDPLTTYLAGAGDHTPAPTSPPRPAQRTPLAP